MCRNDPCETAIRGLRDLKLGDAIDIGQASKQISARLDPTRATMCGHSPAQTPWSAQNPVKDSKKDSPLSARKIIIDTDPGQDDAVAILLALASPDEINVLGITCVAGNVPLELTAKNARMVCELAGRTDVPVYAGCDRPLGRDLVTAEHVHGKTGLDGPDLPDPTMTLEDGHAVDFIIETLRREPANSVTLCPVGPLTNIATAFKTAPDIVEKVHEISLMGGAYFQVGNMTPAAEFNIYVDPQAADVVFRSGAPITVSPLDVTHKALVYPPAQRCLPWAWHARRYCRGRDDRLFRTL